MIGIHCHKPDIKTTIKLSVSRMLKGAQTLMDSDAVGVFPSMKPLAELVKWTARQRQAMDVAIARGAFVPLFDDAATSRAHWLADSLMSAEI